MVHRRLAAACTAIILAAASTAAAQEPVTAVPLGDLLGVLRTVEVAS